MFISHGPMTPVRHLAINLGAPGDIKDSQGTLWLGYPRPDIKAGVKFDIHEAIPEGMGYYSYDSREIEIQGTDHPLLFTSGCMGMQKCEIPLINHLYAETEGSYTVRLGFTSSASRESFNIRIQDRPVPDELDIFKDAGGINRAVIKEYNGIHVKDKLSIAFIAENDHPDISPALVVNFIEILREDIPEKPESQEEITALDPAEARRMLVKASGLMSGNNFSEALDIYHKVFRGSARKDIQITALEGMEEIASTRSLPEIKKHCQMLDPVMWDYRDPDREITRAAVKVYAAIASNLLTEDEARAREMLDHARRLAEETGMEIAPG